MRVAFTPGTVVIDKLEADISRGDIGISENRVVLSKDFFTRTVDMLNKLDSVYATVRRDFSTEIP